jgi:Protein of unknown function (DUF742)
MLSPRDQRLSRAEGPLVRPYALTGGRNRQAGERVDLLASVQSIGSPLTDAVFLEPEVVKVLRLCRKPTPVADLASDLDLPLGVVRILLADMRERGLVSIAVPSANRLTDARVLKDVADALRRL